MQNIQNTHKEFAWQEWEYAHREKGADWFWGVGLVAVALAVFSIIYNNVLFAVLVIVGAFALVIHAVRRPRLITYHVTPKGIFVGTEKHPFGTLDSFWISDEDENDGKLIVQSKKLLSPYLILPLGDEIDEHELREFLFDYLPEEEHHEPISYRLMEHLGF